MCIPKLLPHRNAHYAHWRALAGGRAEGWPIDPEMIYYPCLPVEGHADFRHSHWSSHTSPEEPDEQLCPRPAREGDGVQPVCCFRHRARLRGAARTRSTFNIRQPSQGSQRGFAKEKDIWRKDRLTVSPEGVTGAYELPQLSGRWRGFVAAKGAMQTPARHTL